MRLTLVPETVPVPHEICQLSLLDALDATTPPDPGARPPTPAMLRVLALAVLRSDGEVQAGSLNPGAFNALCLGMAARGLVRVECGAPVVTFAGRVAVRAAEGEG